MERRGQPFDSRPSRAALGRSPTRTSGSQAHRLYSSGAPFPILAGFVPLRVPRTSGSSFDLAILLKALLDGPRLPRDGDRGPDPVRPSPQRGDSGGGLARGGAAHRARIARCDRAVYANATGAAQQATAVAAAASAAASQVALRRHSCDGSVVFNNLAPAAIPPGAGGAPQAGRGRDRPAAAQGVDELAVKAATGSDPAGDAMPKGGNPAHRRAMDGRRMLGQK